MRPCWLIPAYHPPRSAGFGDRVMCHHVSSNGGKTVQEWSLLVSTLWLMKRHEYAGEIWGYSQNWNHPRKVRVGWDSAWRCQATQCLCIFAQIIQCCPMNQYLWIPSMCCLVAHHITGSQTVFMPLYFEESLYYLSLAFKNVNLLKNFCTLLLLDYYISKKYFTVSL